MDERPMTLTVPKWFMDEWVYWQAAGVTNCGNHATAMYLWMKLSGPERMDLTIEFRDHEMQLRDAEELELAEVALDNIYGQDGTEPPDSLLADDEGGE